MNDTRHTNDRRAWTDLDLEMFADDALDASPSDALREALRTDADLRRRLGSIRQVDRLAAEAFDQIAAAPRTERSLRALRPSHLARPLALAACLAIVAVGSYLIGRSGRRAPDQAAPLALAPTDSETPSPVPESPAPRTVRTLFELPMPAGYKVATEAVRAPSDPKPEPTPTRAQPDRSREKEILALGRAIRSADLARATLDTMSGEEQLEACRIWARDPSLRPVAFERLARLQNDPAHAAECARIASAMSEDRNLLAWARSHRLRTDTPPTHQ